MLAGFQVSWFCKAFPLNKGKQMIVTSFNDVTVVLLMLRQGGYMHETLKFLGGFSGHSIIVEGHFLPFSSRSPLTLYLGYLGAL